MDWPASGATERKRREQRAGSEFGLDGESERMVTLDETARSGSGSPRDAPGPRLAMGRSPALCFMLGSLAALVLSPWLRLDWGPRDHSEPPPGPPAQVHACNSNPIAVHLAAVMAAGGCTDQRPCQNFARRLAAAMVAGGCTDQREWRKCTHAAVAALAAPPAWQNCAGAAVAALAAPAPAAPAPPVQPQKPQGCLFHTMLDARSIKSSTLRLYFKSFLVTQPAASKLLVWVPGLDAADGAASLREALATPELAPFAALGAAARLEARSMNDLGLGDAKAQGDAGVSDVLRFAALREHGGIYTDGDGVFLRDLTPLCGSDFTYWWSDGTVSPGPGDAPCVGACINTAVLGCAKKCTTVARFWADQYNPAADPPTNAPRFHPGAVSSWLLKNCDVGLSVLSGALFDPLWVPFDQGELDGRNVARCAPGVACPPLGAQPMMSLGFSDFASFFTLVLEKGSLARLREAALGGHTQQGKRCARFPLLDAFPGTYFYHTHNQRRWGVPNVFAPNTLARVAEDWLDQWAGSARNPLCA
jgi:hypothetical protein